MRVLITGGAGFIGSQIADAHIEKGDDVFIIDNLSTGKEENVNKKARFEMCDIRSDLRGIFNDFRPEVVNHHAAQINVRRSEENPIEDAETNILGIINILNLVREFEVGRFVFSSSGGTLYGETDRIPTKEDHPLNPYSPYGISKLAGEKYVQTILRDSDTNYTILRYGNVYGPRQNPESEAGVISIFINNVLTESPCIIFGDGNQTRDYVHVFDCVAANLLALEKPSGFYNIGTGVETSVNKLIEVIRDVVGKDFEYRHDEPRPGELQRSVLDFSYARERLGWRPRISLRAGIEDTFKYFKSA